MSENTLEVATVSDVLVEIDMYSNTVDVSLNEPNPVTIELFGVREVPGIQGERGIQGPQGTQGDIGLTGAAGADGITQDISGKQDTSGKDATGGYAGLTLFALNLKNAANTFTNFLTNTTTAARTWTFPDKTGTVAMTSDIAAAGSQVQAEDSTGTTVYGWTGQRLYQAAIKWGSLVASVFSGVFSGTATNYREGLYSVTTSANVTIALANGNYQRFILDAARQFTMPANPGAVGASFVLLINCADFTPTWAASPTIKWLTAAGTPAELNTVSGKVNAITFIWDNTTSAWLGFLAGKEA